MTCELFGLVVELTSAFAFAAVLVLGMTYAQQLRDYENEVLKKRYEELSSEELAALSDELEEEDD